MGHKETVFTQIHVSTNVISQQAGSTTNNRNMGISFKAINYFQYPHTVTRDTTMDCLLYGIDSSRSIDIARQVRIVETIDNQPIYVVAGQRHTGFTQCLLHFIGHQRHADS